MGVFTAGCSQTVDIALEVLKSCFDLATLRHPCEVNLTVCHVQSLYLSSFDK